MCFGCHCEFWCVFLFDAGVRIGIRGCFPVFSLLYGMGREGRISVSLSDGVVEGVEGRRGLVERSTFYEDLIRKALDLEPWASARVITMRSRRQ